MNIRVRGISYHFEKHTESVEKPVLILFHGFMGSGMSFSHILESLKEVCAPVTVDLLGHGQTEGAELHYRFSTKEQVADLVKLISEQFTPPVFLYGYSMGARLALQLTLTRPDLIQGLLMESGTFGIEDETERQARQALDASRADQIMGNFSGFLEDWKTLPIFGLHTTDVPEAVSKIQEQQNPVWMSNSLLGFGTGTMPVVRERLHELVAPVQLIVGDQDSKFVQINQTMKKEIANSQLSIIQESGHRAHLDQPEATAETIRNFITKHTLS